MGIPAQEIQHTAITIANILALCIGLTVRHNDSKFGFSIPQKPRVFRIVRLVPVLPCAVFFQSSVFPCNLFVICLLHQVVKLIDGIPFPIFKHGAFTPVADHIRRFGSRRCIHLSLRCLIRIVPPNADVFMILMIVDGSTVVCKAVWFHCAVHISLRCFFCFLQRLKVLLFIKSVLDRMIDHHLIPWRHTLLIAVYRFFGQPFRFIRESIIQFPHFSDLHEYVSCPQMLLVSLSFAQKIFTIAAQTV